MTDANTAPLTTLVAAAKSIAGTKMKRSHSQKWQDEAWQVYDEVGELRYTANTLSNATSRAKLFAARLPLSDDEPDPIDPHADEFEEETDTPENDRVAAEAVQAIGGGALGRAELLRRLAVQLFVPGDGYLVGLPPGVFDDHPEPDGGLEGLPPDVAARDEVSLSELSWHCLAVSEVSVRGNQIVLKVEDEERQVAADDAVLIRVWRPHPRKWWEADSPVKANLPVLRELIGLTKHVGANIDSRLAGAGLLCVPNTVEVQSPAVEDPDTDHQSTPTFTQALIETMTTPIRDRDSAAAVVPLVAKLPPDAIGKVQHIQFSTPFDQAAKDLRDEAIRRLALGLDAPPEVLLGLGDTNHWSAWQIEESTVKIHVEPVLALICDALTTEFLWPVLEEARVDNARDYVVWFDTADLTLRPNRTGEAQEAYDRGELDGTALRRESGFEEHDAPEKVDRAVEIALNIVQGSPELMGDPGLRAVITEIRAALAEGRAAAQETPAEEGTPAPEPEPEPDAEPGGPPDTQGEPPPETVGAEPVPAAAGNGRV